MPDNRAIGGVERVEIIITSTYIDYSIDHRRRTHYAKRVTRRTCGAMTQVGRPDLLPVQTRGVLVPIERAPVDHAGRCHRLGEDHPSCRRSPVNLQVGGRGRIDDGLDFIVAAAPAVKHIGWPVARTTRATRAACAACVG